MVEDGSLGRPCGAGVVVQRDAMEELRTRGPVELRSVLLDQAQSEMDVSEQAPLVGRAERGRRAELEGPARVVEQRGCKQEIGSETRMELRDLATHGRHADRVLEEAAGVGLMPVGGRGIRPEVGGCENALDQVPEAGVRDLGGQELEEALELVHVAAHRRRERCRVGLGSRLDRANGQLEPVAEALHPPQHAHGVAFVEPRVVELDVLPDPRVDSAARIDELEREVRSPALRPQPLLARDRVDAFDDPLFGELRDRVHGPILGPDTDGRVEIVAVVKPFRALRYDEAKAGPLDPLVAPPFDVISAAEREELRARSQYNVVHLTLPDSEADAARDFAEWQRERILVRDEEPSLWALSQRYVGPDGVERTRNGVVASLRLEPYEKRIVLPHELTHAGPKADRLRLLRSVRAELEPIFLLYDGPPVELPDREPDLETEGARLWRIDKAPDLSAKQLLIADGHHRYETALAFHAEDGTEASAYLMVVLVSTHDEGLTIFPTHRIVDGLDGRLQVREGVDEGPLDALERISHLPRGRPVCVFYGHGVTEILEAPEVELLDTAFVADLIGSAHVAYTPKAEEAVAAVDRGEAEAAFLLRPTRIEDVFAVAERGETMPQKSTYFYPKLVSGLLFHPL